jgi:glutathione S-transferase
MQEAFEEGIEKAKKELAYFDAYLAEDHDFIAGDSFTLADANLCLVCFFAMRAGATFAEYPHLLKYAERMKDRQSVQDTWPPHWKESPNKDWLTAL